MISYFFWILSICTVILIIINIVKKKTFFSILTYTLIGIYLPLFLSFMDWSYYHIDNKTWEFYYIFILLDIICIIYSFGEKKTISSIKNIQFLKKKNKIPIEIYNVIYILCVLIENIYLSGFLFPSLKGMDVHTGRMPFIYFITTGVYIVLIGDIIEFLCTKKIKYIIYAIICFLINIISKSARVDAGIAIIQIISFILLYYLSKEKRIAKNDNVIVKKKSKFIILIVLIIAVVILIGKGMEVGNERMNSYGKYKTVYTEGIRYDGPDSPNDFLAYYYGYFSLSFDNLNYNIEHATSKINLVGLNSFRCLYFGIFQFDNLFGLNGGASSRANLIRCKGAAVSTIFWDFYYDYDILFFIPVIITFYIASLITKIFVKKQTVMTYILYFFWIPLWMFSSFDNRSYDFQIIWQIIIMWIIYRNRFVMITDDNRNTVSYHNAKIFKKRRFKI